MNDNSWIYRNQKGAVLEIFRSEKEGFYTLIYTAASGDVYSSSIEIPESGKIEAVRSFMNNEENIDRFIAGEKVDKKGAIKKDTAYNLIGFSILVLFFGIALFRSNFSWKVILLFVPVMIIISFRCFILKKARK